MQVLQVILAGKGQKDHEIYQQKQYLKAQLDCYKTGLYAHKEKHQNISCKIFWV